jgi:uridine kinase
MGKNEPTLKAVSITISGDHDSGKTTLANLVKMCLEENGYKHISLKDVEPLPHDEKDRFPERFDRNRNLRAVDIRVLLAGEV